MRVNVWQTRGFFADLTLNVKIINFSQLCQQSKNLHLFDSRKDYTFKENHLNMIHI